MNPGNDMVARPRVHAIVDVYPHPFKPYFDTQFADWVEAGYDVSVTSLHRFDAWAPVEVQTVETLRTAPLRIAARLLYAMAVSPRRCWRALRSGISLTEGIKNLALDCQLTRVKPDVMLIHNLTTATRFAFLSQSLPGVPLAMYYHGGELPGVPAVAQRDSERALPMFAHVFSNTAYSIAEVIARGARPATTRRLPVGFRVSDYPDIADRAYRGSDGKLRLISVGRAAPEKGFDIALRALAQLRDGGTQITYTLVGDGPEFANLKALTDELGLTDCVRFLGKLPSTEILAHLRDADAMLLTSVPGNTWVEIQACVMQEAMLARVPVIASDLGGVRESIPEAMREYMFKPGDHVQLAEQITRVARLSNAALHELGNTGREFVVANYDSVPLNKRLVEICLLAASTQPSVTVISSGTARRA